MHVVGLFAKLVGELLDVFFPIFSSHLQQYPIRFLFACRFVGSRRMLRMLTFASSQRLWHEFDHLFAHVFIHLGNFDADHIAIDDGHKP